MLCGVHGFLRYLRSQVILRYTYLKINKMNQRTRRISEFMKIYGEPTNKVQNMYFIWNFVIVAFELFRYDV